MVAVLVVIKVSVGAMCVRHGPNSIAACPVQVYLAHKKQRPPRTLQ